jgi:integrase
MGIKFDTKTQLWIAFFSKRHPITRQPKSLKRINLKSQAEALRVERELVVEIEKSFVEDIMPKWKVAVETWCEAAVERGLTLRTVENYKLGLVAHTYGDWAHRKIDSITTSEIRQLIQTKLSHRSPNQQKNVLKFIRAVFSESVERGYINRNPAPQMKFRIGDKIKGVLTVQQMELLLNKAKELNCEWYYHWVLACYTGMRNGELYALTWDKVDLENRQILVNCSWNNKDGFKSTKSGDDRIVEIAPSLITVLKELKLVQGDSNFVLPRLDKWDKGEQARELRMFLMGLGIQPVRFHDLRASWATLMLSRGVEPIKVMKMGGWKDMKTMMIYMRKAGVDIKGITDGLELHNPSRNAAAVISLQKA